MKNTHFIYEIIIDKLYFFVERIDFKRRYKKGFKNYKKHRKAFFEFKKYILSIIEKYITEIPIYKYEFIRYKKHVNNFSSVHMVNKYVKKVNILIPTNKREYRNKKIEKILE